MASEGSSEAVVRVHPLNEALAMAACIVASGPLATSATERLPCPAAITPHTVRDAQAELQPQGFASEDSREGARAFIGKRSAAWRGR